MNRFLHGVVRAVAESVALPGPILEVGSYQVPGQEEIAQLRGLLRDQPYLGIDVRPGPGVDEVADVEALPYGDESFGTVLALNTFEHVRHFWRGFEEIHRVLRPNGVLLVTMPFYFHIHDYPSDYWRFTPEALDVLLQPYPHRFVGRQGPSRRPSSVWALAFREDHPEPTLADLDRYRALVAQYAREPLSWTRRLRYGIGRLICGRGPFAPYLDRECWEIEWRTSPLPSNRTRSKVPRPGPCRQLVPSTLPAPAPAS